VVTVDKNGVAARIMGWPVGDDGGLAGETGRPVSQISTVGKPVPVRCQRPLRGGPYVTVMTRIGGIDGMASHDLSWSKNSRACCRVERNTMSGDHSSRTCGYPNKNQHPGT